MLLLRLWKTDDCFRRTMVVGGWLRLLCLMGTFRLCLDTKHSDLVSKSFLPLLASLSLPSAWAFLLCSCKSMSSVSFVFCRSSWDDNITDRAMSGTASVGNATSYWSISVSCSNTLLGKSEIIDSLTPILSILDRRLIWEFELSITRSGKDCTEKPVLSCEFIHFGSEATSRLLISVETEWDMVATGRVSLLCLFTTLVPSESFTVVTIWCFLRLLPVPLDVCLLLRVWLPFCKQSLCVWDILS